MQRSKSSKRWLKEHFDDPFVKQAQTAGYRSRAVYKLKEIDDKERLLKPGMTVVDLGAAPGGWTQYVAEKIGCRKGEKESTIIALDCLPMDALPGVDVILGDFTEEKVLEELQSKLTERSVDLVLSDMAPNMSGNPAVDMPRAMYLAELALAFSYQTLKPGGTLVMKLFHGEGFDALVKEIRPRFKRIVIRKPQASRSRSRETYLLAKHYIL
ncbi:MAG: 23S rRNA (uridine(2552)-2'-O)-methyltransferase RlmE [Gammaproteobacteria bacterium]|nr:23S rRNA (uridine(2552)-2'-O)-methyltransferase RlmE [Gammaproteobacteria bacterium]